MASANDLIVLFLGLEMLSIAAVRARRQQPPPLAEPGGAASSTSCSAASPRRSSSTASPCVYGGTGIDEHLRRSSPSLQTTVASTGHDALVLAGIALLLVGLGFKVAAVPFHVWAPDVYQGAPTPVTAFMASAGKAAAFAALLRVLVVALPFYRDDWRPVIWVLGVAVAGRRVGPRRRADRRQADAGLLVDQPRRVHPRRRRGRGPPGR